MPNAAPVPGARQLLAIARDVMRSASISDVAELSEAIKCRLARLGFAYPPPHEIADAITRVLPTVPPPSPGATSSDEQHTPRDVEPLAADEARAVLTQLHARFGKTLPPLKPHAMPPGASELMTTRERYALVHDVERLRTLLRLRRENRDADEAKD